MSYKCWFANFERLYVSAREFIYLGNLNVNQIINKNYNEYITIKCSVSSAYSNHVVTKA